MPISPDAPPVASYEDLMTEEEILSLFGVPKTRLTAFRYGGRTPAERARNLPLLPYLRLANRTWYFKNQIAWWLGEMQKEVDLKHLSNITSRRGKLSRGRDDFKKVKKDG